MEQLVQYWLDLKLESLGLDLAKKKQKSICQNNSLITIDEKNLETLHHIMWYRTT